MAPPQVPVVVEHMRWHGELGPPRMQGPQVVCAHAVPEGTVHATISVMPGPPGTQVPTLAQIPSPQLRTALPVQVVSAPMPPATQGPSVQLTQASPVGSWEQTSVETDTLDAQTPAAHANDVVVTSTEPAAEQLRPVPAHGPRVVATGPHAVPLVSLAQGMEAVLETQVPAVQAKLVMAWVPDSAQRSA